MYPGKLQLQIDDPFVNVPVDNDTNITDLVRAALDKFGLQDTQVEDYRQVVKVKIIECFYCKPFFFF